MTCTAVLERRWGRAWREGFFTLPPPVLLGCPRNTWDWSSGQCLAFPKTHPLRKGPAFSAKPGSRSGVGGVSLGYLGRA